MNLIDRFIKYVQYETTSDENSASYPSSLSQKNFAKILFNDLKELGVKDLILDEYSLIYGGIEGDSSLPTIGLIAHMDTSPELQGGNFTPKIIENYDGGIIELNKTYRLDPQEFTNLKDHLNQTLIVTDGEHLLGGDDKAGIVIIFEIIEYYLSHPEIKHAPIRFCFTPDEEIGNGASHFSIHKMKADIAYTIDGGRYNEVNYENFNAYSVSVKVLGRSVHPGSAKNLLLNAITIAMEYHDLLPKDMVPERTEGYEGFNHLCDIKGSVEECKMSYIVRNHDLNQAKRQVQMFLTNASIIQEKYPHVNVIVTYKESYRNMYDYFKDHPLAIDKLKIAFEKAKEDIVFNPIRGGTDGAHITFMGLPCPNLGTGDYNCHGRYEYVSVDEMKKVVKILKALLEA